MIGKGDKFVLDLIDEGLVTQPTPTIIAYAALRAIGPAIIQQVVYAQLVDIIIKKNHFKVSAMQSQAKTAVLQFGSTAIFMAVLVMAWQATWTEQADMRVCLASKDWYQYPIQLASLVIAIATRPV